MIRLLLLPIIVLVRLIKWSFRSKDHACGRAIFEDFLSPHIKDKYKDDIEDYDDYEDYGEFEDAEEVDNNDDYEDYQ